MISLLITLLLVTLLTGMAILLVANAKGTLLQQKLQPKVVEVEIENTLYRRKKFTDISGR